MYIKEIKIKNFKSFGNSEQTLKLSTEKGELILLSGSNGNGKSLVKETEIEIEIPIDKFNIQDIIYFLDIMGEESDILLYIKENNSFLYDEYIKYRSKQKFTK